MELTTGLALLGVILLVVANGFFVATEFAIVAVRRARLEQLVAEGKTGARAALNMVRQLDAYIAATQLGITMASLALGWLGEPAFAALLEPPLASLVGTFAPAAAHAAGIGIAFAAITVLHITLGEQIPKMLALQMPDATTLWVAPSMRVFYLIFRWPIVALQSLTNAALRVIGLAPTTGHEMVHSVEELRLLVTSSQRAGVVEASEARIAQRAFVFADLTAGALMTPRTELEGLPLDAGRDELIELLRGGRQSRLVVYRESLDDVVGVVRVRDLIDLFASPERELNLAAYTRPVLTVPATKPADDLVEEMRAQRRHFALVLDEYGGTAGVVTLEDLVQGLIGRIDEEPPLGSPDEPHEEPSADGSLLLDGMTRLDEFEELTGLELDEDARDASETLGGLVMAALGRMPAVGDEVVVGGQTLRVEKLDRLRVEQVRLLPGERAAPKG